jgi:hypothetical protein
MQTDLESAIARLREHAPHLTTRQPWRYQGSVEADLTLVLLALDDEMRKRLPGGGAFHPGPKTRLKDRRESE